MESTHTWEQLKAYVDLHALGQDLRYHLDGKWYTVWLSHDGPSMVARFKIGTLEADAFEAGYKAGIIQTVRPRQSTDGSFVMKGDPGGPGDDPMFEPGNTTVAPSGTAIIWHSDPTQKLFGLIVQVKDGKPGDRLRAVVGLISDDTEVGTFGEVNAPMPKSSTGWGERTILFGTSKAPVLGTKYGIRLTTTAAAGDREFLLDYLMQKPE